MSKARAAMVSLKDVRASQKSLMWRLFKAEAPQEMHEVRLGLGHGPRVPHQLHEPCVAIGRAEEAGHHAGAGLPLAAEVEDEHRARLRLHGLAEGRQVLLLE